MPCSTTCIIATAIIIGSIYFHNSTSNNEVVKEYKKQLPSHLLNIYEKISSERLRINNYGYLLGLIISLIIIWKNVHLKRDKLTTPSLVCLVVVVSFLTNYFYYILSPKSTYMLEHINSPEQTKAWLLMYREMQYNFHLGMVIGIIGVGVLAYGFRC